MQDSICQLYTVASRTAVLIVSRPDSLPNRSLSYKAREAKMYSPKDYWSNLAEGFESMDRSGFAPVLHPQAPSWFNQVIDALQFRALRRALAIAEISPGARRCAALLFLFRPGPSRRWREFVPPFWLVTAYSSFARSSERINSFLTSVRFPS
jgi:hypothetical protein